MMIFSFGKMDTVAKLAADVIKEAGIIVDPGFDFYTATAAHVVGLPVSCDVKETDVKTWFNQAAVDHYFERGER